MKTPAHIAKRILYTVLGLALVGISCHGKGTDRLRNAASPYLREQAGDPVDWYEWGDEALQEAKKMNKPLLVSVGYSSCHWCHMMEKESFRDTAVARIMNEDFICIKVDREERPDIDNVYGSACRLISGSSGWPLNAFALPDGKPFFAGTYYSRQSWMNLLQQIVVAYHTQKEKVDLQAGSLSAGIAGLELPVAADSAADVAGKAAYRHIFEDLYEKMDRSSGGLRGTPKFPIPSSIEFLLQYYFLTKDKRSLDAATVTLTKMALGGIYDQVGGGFARYSIDSLWHIPHFEKMLYDNAQLISVYAHAYQLTGNVFFKNVLQEIIGFTQRDLGNPEGGYSCSLDADTRDGEGTFYAWSARELKEAMPDDYAEIADYYHVSGDGNWKEDKNVLYADRTPVQFAATHHIASDLFSTRLATAKQVLLSQRNKRERPAADDKVLTSWNALLMTGYLDAYAALGNGVYLQEALNIARFLERNRIQKDGSLCRLFKVGKASVNGFLDDYALLAKAYIGLYELTFDKHWLELSRGLTRYAIANFYDPGSGMFYYTPIQAGNEVVRRIAIADNELPSSNATMAGVLYALGDYFQDEDYLGRSARMISRAYEQFRKGGAVYYASWCLLPGLSPHGANEVAIVGKEALAKGLELQKNYLPLSLFLGSAAKEDLPLLQGKFSDNKTLIYICSNKTCQRPVENLKEALDRLK